MSTHERTVEILWTGGFDSTYRVCQLSRLPVTIKPYYLTGGGSSGRRPSEVLELTAIEKATKLLKEKPATKANLLPLTVLSQEERVDSSEIADAYERLLVKDYFGSQYITLGSFAALHKGLELSIHQDDKAIFIIQKYGGLKEVNDPILGQYFVLDAEKSSGDVRLIFENFHFPLAMLTKLDQKKQYLEWGYEDVMESTWFCYTPKDGKPCGTCAPCRYTIEEGLKERFTFMALMRYRKVKFQTLLNKFIPSSGRKNPPEHP